MAFNPHSPAMSPHTSPLLNRHSVEKEKWLYGLTGWMNALQKKNVTTTGLQRAEIYGVHEHY